MIYTIDYFKIYKEGFDWTETVYASIDEYETKDYFKSLCSQPEAINADHFIEYNMHEWVKPDLKCLLDTWNNGYLKKKKKNETVHDD